VTDFLPSDRRQVFGAALMNLNTKSLDNDDVVCYAIIAASLRTFRFEVPGSSALNTAADEAGTPNRGRSFDGVVFFQ
jgi:hypothetical protein